jgi:hypothetical protein
MTIHEVAPTNDSECAVSGHPCTDNSLAEADGINSATDTAAMPRLYRDRVVHRIHKEHDVTVDQAALLVTEAEKFLRYCATATEPASPSPAVDLAWHEMILYTKEYADYCSRLAGRFIHHSPSDETGKTYAPGGAYRTFVTMTNNGYAPDTNTWIPDEAPCCAPGLVGPEDALTQRLVASGPDYCTGDSCSGGGCDGDSGCAHR